MFWIRMSVRRAETDRSPRNDQNGSCHLSGKMKNIES